MSRHVMSCHVPSYPVALRRVALGKAAATHWHSYLTLTIRKRTPLTLTLLIIIPLAFAQLTLTPLTRMRPRSSV